MDNHLEAERWMKDAGSFFKRAERCFKERDWQGSIQNSQLAIELSAKALISLFEEPEWTHNPHAQFRRIIEDRRKEIEKIFGSDFFNELYAIIEEIKKSSPWHGWCIYGKEDEDGKWISAVDLCTEDVARNLFESARRCFTVIEKFLKGVKG
jgi:HEPN domain-containing protein